MGTRGSFGFYYKGKYYMVYNHLDSYNLYHDLITEIMIAVANGTFQSWIGKLENIQCVTRSRVPTEEEIKKLGKYADFRVSTQSPKEWYFLLRGCQGSYEKVLDAGFIENYVDKNGDLIREEFTCVLNFDDNTFESYEYGSNKKIESLDEVIKNYNSTKQNSN